MPHPYLAASISIDPENVIGRQAVGIISVVPVVFELPSAFIKPVKTATPASQPEIAARIFENAVDVTAFVPVFRAGKVMRHLSCLPVQSIQRARGEPYPENALGILVNRSDRPPRETIRIAGPMRITAELLLAEVENVKPPILGSHPQHAASILVNRHNGIIIEAIRVAVGRAERGASAVLCAGQSNIGPGWMAPRSPSVHRPEACY